MALFRKSYRAIIPALLLSLFVVQPTQAATGDNCGSPIQITLPNDMPYSDTGYTCGRIDDYDSTCLGNYDGGEDIIYRISVLEPVDIDITLDPLGTTWNGMTIDNSCPPDGDCIATSTSSAGSSHTIYALHLSPGTYYLMIDTWPSPECIPEFQLDIAQAEISGPGNDCNDPISLFLPDSLPYYSSNTTCERNNSYDETCLGNYDNGQDIIYSIDVSSAVTVDITLDPKGTTYTGIVIDSLCPPGNDCIAMQAGYSGSPKILEDIHLEPGQYYIMIDTWPSPDCIPDFDLTIERRNQLPIITNSPLNLTASHCDFLTYDFDAFDADGDRCWIEKIEGPGLIHRRNTGVWYYDASNFDEGDLGYVSLHACDESGCSEPYMVDIILTNSPPVLDCGADISVLYGSTIEKTDITGDDPDGCERLSFTLIDGPGQIDQTSGKYTWITTEGDIGQYRVDIALSDGMENYSGYFNISVEPIDYIFGNANADGQVDVADAVYLINYIFKNGPPPQPLEAGDANCDDLVNVGDGVYLINFVFKNGPEPCGGPRGACCLDMETCEVQPRAVCEFLGGTYYGDGTDCGEIECDRPCCEAPLCDPNPDVEPEYEEDPPDPNCHGDFGYTLAGHEGSVSGRFFACCLVNSWQIRAVSITSHYEINACAQGRTVVDSPGDPTVDGNNCRDVIEDFVAQGANPPCADYDDYVSLVCVTLHEQVHLSEWKTAFDAAWDDAEDQIEQIVVPCIITEIDTPEEAVAEAQEQIDDIVEAARESAYDNWPDDPPNDVTPPGPSNAYPAENACLAGIIAAIIAAYPAECAD